MLTLNIVYRDTKGVRTKRQVYQIVAVFTDEMPDQWEVMMDNKEVGLYMDLIVETSQMTGLLPW